MLLDGQIELFFFLCFLVLVPSYHVSFPKAGAVVITACISPAPRAQHTRCWMKKGILTAVSVSDSDVEFVRGKARSHSQVTGQVTGPCWPRNLITGDVSVSTAAHQAGRVPSLCLLIWQ